MKGILKLLLINAIPLLLAVALAVDLFSAIGSTSTYPFGSDFFPSTSIYRSKAIYCAYNLVTIFLLLLLLPLSYRGRWKWTSSFWPWQASCSLHQCLPPSK